MQVHSSCLFQSLPERPATIACPRHCSEEVCRAAIVEEQVGPLPVGRNKTRQEKTRQDKTGQEGHSRKRQRRHKATGHAQQRHVALQSNPATSDETPTASNMLAIITVNVFTCDRYARCSHSSSLPNYCRQAPRPIRTNAPLSEFSLCLSRGCPGKKIIF